MATKKKNYENLNAASVLGVGSAASGYFSYRSHKVLKRIPKARENNLKRMNDAIEIIKTKSGTPEAAKAAKKIPYYKLGDDFVNKAGRSLKTSRNYHGAIAATLAVGTGLAIAKHLSDNKSTGDKIKSKVEKGKKLPGKKGRYIFRFFGGRVVPIKVG